MKRASIVVYCCMFLITLMAASTVQAGGFALYEWSNRGVAMGSSGYAQGVDASVIATNPALMTKLKGKHGLAGFFTITPHSSVITDGVKTKTKNDTYAVPHAYYVQQLESNPNVWLGVGLFTRFGLGTRYDEDWVGKNKLQDVELYSQSLNPNIAFKFSDDFSMAVGVEILRGGIDLNNDPGFTVSAHTTGYALGGNLAFSYDINDDWSAGLTYRAPMKMYTTGSGQFDYPLAPGSTKTEQSIESTLPGSYSFGIAYKGVEDLTLEFDVIHTRWDSVDKMTYSGAINTVDELRYKNTWRFQVGGEYWAMDWLALRLGYAYDQTPTRSAHASYMLPVNDRQLFSTGLGFKWNKWLLDWSFLYVVAKERSGLTIDSKPVEFKDGKTWVTGLSLGYEF